MRFEDKPTPLNGSRFDFFPPPSCRPQQSMEMQDIFSSSNLAQLDCDDSNLRRLSLCYRLRSELANEGFQYLLKNYLQRETDHSLILLLDLLITCQKYFSEKDVNLKSQYHQDFKQGFQEYMLEQGMFFHARDIEQENLTENLLAEFYLSGIAKLSGLDFIQNLVDEFRKSH